MLYLLLRHYLIYFIKLLYLDINRKLSIYKLIIVISFFVFVIMNQDANIYIKILQAKFLKKLYNFLIL